MKQYSPLEAERILIKNGFVFIGQKGSHRKYKRGSESLVIPCKKVNKMLWLRLTKEFKINLNN